MQVLGVSGSLGRDSSTLRALRIALEAAERAGAEICVMDLRDMSLPFCDGRNSEEYPSAVQEWRGAVRRADGVIFASPEYHNSLTGSLKNAIDLLDMNDMKGKMCGLIGVAGGSQGAGHTINALRTILRAFGAWVVPHQVSVSNASRVFTPDGGMHDAPLQTRLETLGTDVAHFAALFAEHHTH
jgi:FMN reductase